MAKESLSFSKRKAIQNILIKTCKVSAMRFLNELEKENKMRYNLSQMILCNLASSRQHFHKNPRKLLFATQTALLSSLKSIYPLSYSTYALKENQYFHFVGTHRVREVCLRFEQKCSLRDAAAFIRQESRESPPLSLPKREERLGNKLEQQWLTCQGSSACCSESSLRWHKLFLPEF